MTADELKSQIALGEDSHRQFKQNVTNADALAAEMAAFANSEGGVILLGVADDGSAPGLILSDVARLNQLISNAASQHVRSPLTVRTENLELDNGRIVVVLTVPKGTVKLPSDLKSGTFRQWMRKRIATPDTGIRPKSSATQCGFTSASP